MTEAIPDYPEEGDLVVCTVKSVRNFGAFVELEEYLKREGFIHVAEIATGWVKRMSDYVREGQRVVCKVLKVDKSKGHIDLSLKKVNAHQKREKIQLWKNDQKAEKLIEIVAQRLQITPDEFMEEHAVNILAEFDSLYGAFEAAASEEGLGKKKLKGTWIKTFCEVAKENVTVSTASVNGILEISCVDRDGVDKVKAALLAAEKHGDGKVVVQYLGAPRYLLIASDDEFKSAESILVKASEAAIASIKTCGGTGKFVREGAQ